MTEIIFLFGDYLEGGYVTRAINESIFTQADSIPELREMVKDAIDCHYPDEKNCLKSICYYRQGTQYETNSKIYCNHRI